MKEKRSPRIARLMRRSLFLRMFLLFGMLVTLTLAVSALLLGYTGWNSMRSSGDQVSNVGRHVLARTVAAFKSTAEEQMTGAAQQVTEAGKNELDRTLDEARQAGDNAINVVTDRMRTRGSRALTSATAAMQKVSRESLDKSLATLDRQNREALQALAIDFTRRMNAAVNKNDAGLREQLKRELQTLWDETASRRVQAVRERLGRAKSELVLRLELPLRLAAIQNRNEEQAPRLLYEKLFKNSRQELVRAMLISRNGQEWARWPENDLRAGEEPPDWSGSPLRRQLFDGAGRMFVTSPISWDEASDSWIVRLAHRINPEQQPAQEAASPEADAEPVSRYGSFIVVDMRMNNLVEQAQLERPAGGFELLAVHVPSKKVISSSTPAQINAQAAELVAQLSTAPDGAPRKELDIVQAGFNNRRALAQYWGPEEDVWAVAIQPEAEIFQPVSEMAAGIQRAWLSSLEQVSNDANRFIGGRTADATKQKRALAQAARRRMEQHQSTLTRTVHQDLADERRAQVQSWNRDVKRAIAGIKVDAGKGMDSETAAMAAATAAAVSKNAEQELARSDEQIRRDSRTIAADATGKMLARFSFVIPLFLLLALALAALTARSLVRPINQLVSGTHAIAAGDYDRRVETRGSDELSRLALAFNHMAGAIQTVQAELQQSHDHLATEKARIEAMLQASPDGLVMFEPDGRVSYINPSARALLDLSPADTNEQLPPAVEERLAAAQRAAADGVGTYEWQEPERRVLQCREVPLSNCPGYNCGRLLHLHDVTRERIIDEMKSDFISLVSHELRTPLTSILGFSSYILTGRMGEISSGQQAALESIHRQARRLAAIISDFLDISRIESGRIQMHKAPVALPQVAERVVQDLAPQATERQIQVRTLLEDEADKLIAVGDEQRITQVFTNLVGNSLKFTEGNGMVDVVLSRRNGHLLCTVSDTGCGIPADELPRVFDRFYQVEKVVVRKTGGTGLGLAIVKNIVEAHDGEISISSEIGKGTTVQFTLPPAGDVE